MTFGETVTVMRATTITDRYGNEKLDWDEPATVAVTGCSVAAQDSSENFEARTAVLVGLTVFMPVGTDVTAHDRLEVRGVVYEVVGEPMAWTSPFPGGLAGVEVQVGRVDG